MMKIYGFEVKKNGNATLTLMERERQGEPWKLTDIKSGPKQSIMAECEQLNRELAAK